MAEKTLPPWFLSLRERVELRHHVRIVRGPTFTLVLLPQWDLDGPDITFFKAEQEDLPTAVKGGPVVLDGRAMVADAQDLTALVLEAADQESKELRMPVHIKFTGGAHKCVNRRGWDFGTGPFHAWWSGVRKGVERAGYFLRSGSAFEAVAAVNPFADMKHKPGISYVGGMESLLNFDHVPRGSWPVVVVPVDIFASLGTQAAVVALLRQCPVVPVGSTPVARASWMSRVRNPMWNPQQLYAKLRAKDHGSKPKAESKQNGSASNVSAAHGSGGAANASDQ